MEIILDKRFAYPGQVCSLESSMLQTSQTLKCGSVPKPLSLLIIKERKIKHLTCTVSFSLVLPLKFVGFFLPHLVEISA